MFVVVWFFCIGKQYFNKEPTKGRGTKREWIGAEPLSTMFAMFLLCFHFSWMQLVSQSVIHKYTNMVDSWKGNTICAAC